MNNSSKLMMQLNCERKNTTKFPIDQEKIEDIYSILTKIESKNLMVTEWLCFLVEKGFIKNGEKIHTFMDIYDDIKKSDDCQNLQNSKAQQDEKFTKKKFITALKKVAKTICPSSEDAFERIVLKKIVSSQHSDVRIRVEDIRKYITRQVVEILRNYEREFQIIFQIYMPENFNSKTNFTWQQLRFLQKKIPIMAFFRFLWEAQICPHHISATHFFEVTSKLIPSSSMLHNQNAKQNMFYSSDTIITYTKQAINLPKIKTIQGDIGLNFLDFSLLVSRLSVQITKEKNNYATSLLKFLELIHLKQLIGNKGEVKGKPTAFEEKVKKYYESFKKINKNNLQVQKRETKKKIEEIMELHDDQEDRKQFKQTQIPPSQFLAIKKSLDDDQLPAIPEPQIKQKENDSSYNVENKHIIIGEQLPKIPEKNKAAAPRKTDKKDEQSNRFPMQQIFQPDLSSDHYNEIIKKPSNNSRINTEYPVILTQILYPHDLPDIYINPKAEIYLQTTYIHLGERNYQKAYLNFCKARTICENSKNILVQFFFTILEAQIYESAGRDGNALLHYHRAKQLCMNPINKNKKIKAIAYQGLAACLYHLEQYQYAFSCFLKVIEIKGDSIELESTEKAILENNIGCCLMVMNRNTQATKHFALSHDILDLSQGTFNQRTLVVQQNSLKNKKAYIDMKPAFKTMWKTYAEKNPFKSQKVEVKKGKK